MVQILKFIADSGAVELCTIICTDRELHTQYR